MAMLILAVISLTAAIALDSFFKFRMVKLGHRWVFLKGGSFDYKEYHKERVQRGWAAWPVYLMWALLTCGLALLLGSFFEYFVTQPTR
jgi:hypothetical protein